MEAVTTHLDGHIVRRYICRTADDDYYDVVQTQRSARKVFYTELEDGVLVSIPEDCYVAPSVRQVRPIGGLVRFEAFARSLIQVPQIPNEFVLPAQREAPVKEFLSIDHVRNCTIQSPDHVSHVETSFCVFSVKVKSDVRDLLTSKVLRRRRPAINRKFDKRVESIQSD